MRKASLRWKTVNFLFVVVALAFVIGIVLCAIFSTSFFVNLKQRSMLELYEKLNSGMPADSVATEIFDFCEEEGITLLEKDSAGNVIYSFGHSDTMSQRLDDITFSGEAINSEGSRIIEESRDYTLQIINSPEEGKKNSYIEMWGFLNDGNSFIARSSLKTIQNNIRMSLGFFAVVCVAILVVCAVAIYFIIGYYSKPLTRLAALAQKVNEGDFDSSSYEYKHLRQDEIGVLGENIREIGEKLEKNIAELKTSNLNLENELKAKTAQEEARKKYMSDVSHELKTPIALIEGYAEGLKEGIFTSPEDQEYYLNVIMDEAEKMNVIIKRLSILNQLEEGVSAVSLERFNIVAAIDGFLNAMAVIIEDKGANIFFDSKRTIYVWSDEFLFEEALVNYFNNALNHMDENKIIRINVERQNENVRVTVYNSGENIPEEELENIWGKFYKVDKARTREYGGSGLGLSIVKAVADSLHQECGVYNLPDGVAFWIDLEYAGGFTEEEIPEEEHPRLKLTELPIWKKTASTANKLISGAGKKAEHDPEVKEKSKPKKERPQKKKEPKKTKEKAKKKDQEDATDQ